MKIFFTGVSLGLIKLFTCQTKRKFSSERFNAHLFLLCDADNGLNSKVDLALSKNKNNLFALIQISYRDLQNDAKTEVVFI